MNILASRTYVAVAIAFLSLEALAQSVVLNNYNRYPIGEVGGLQAGAFIARADDPSAAWYNPAGLALTEESTLTGSASLYELMNIKLGSANARESVGSNANFIAYSGRLGGVPVAFSIAQPVNFSATVSNRDVSPSGTKLTQDSATQFEIISPGISSAHSFSGKLRAGAALRAYFVSFKNTDAVNFINIDRQVQSGKAVEDGSALSLGLEGGLQYALTEQLLLGVNMRLPLGQLSSSGFRRLVGPSVQFVNGRADVVDLEIDDDDADFEYKLPFEIGIGVAWIGETIEGELSVRYYAPISNYDMFGDSEIEVRSNRQAPDLELFEGFRDLSLETRSVVNLSSGVRYRWDERYSVLGGVFTDQSPVSHRDTNGRANNVFNSVDQWGISLGLLRQSKKGSLSFGVVYTNGEDNNVSIPNIDADDRAGFARETLKVRSLGFLLSTSGTF